ncbi:MAG: hypothetical protein OQK45_06700 [Sulfurovum sp.]|nr:hypothetical protein [Sulfurovum sp.]
MRHVLIALLILFAFTGCEDKEEQAKHDAQIAQKAKAELLAELEAKKVQEEKEHTKLNKMGINVDDGTITIDTNKTKDFFNNLGKKMDMQMKKISADLEKGILETKEAGVEINEQHIHIDLNKTNELLLDWGKKIQVFAQEFDEMAKTLEINSTNTTNKGM